MPTSQDLVPTDQPYGDRTAFLEAASVAGVPLSTADGAGGSPIPPSRPVQPGVVPPNFDVFANREPAPDAAPVTAVDMRKQRLLEHPNPLYRDLAQRILT